MHRRAVRPHHPRAQTEPGGFRRQHLDMPRHRIIAFVAVDIDGQTAIRRDAAEPAQRLGPRLHRAFEMRDAADHIDAHVERAQQVRFGVRTAQQAILRKGDQLQVDVRGHKAADLDQRLGRGQAVVADIDMGADGQQPLCHGQIAIAQGAFHHRLDRQQRLQFAPERDAFQQRARPVQPGQAQAERGIHVKMRVDEGRRGKATGGVDLAQGLRVDGRAEADDPPALHRDIQRPSPIHQPRIPNDKIEHGVPRGSLAHIASKCLFFVQAKRDKECTTTSGAGDRAFFRLFFQRLARTLVVECAGSCGSGWQPFRKRKEHLARPRQIRFHLMQIRVMLLETDKGSRNRGNNRMFEIRLHGRGGQGVVTAAELLSVAAFGEGKHAQAFPSFGSERMGAPIASYCRLSDAEIRLREPIMEPDALIIQDQTLLHSVDVFSGLKPDGFLLINSRRSAADLGISDFTDRLPPGHVACVDATGIAQRHIGRPLPNAALLGAFAAVTRVLSLAAVVRAIEERFAGKIGAANVAAAREAHDAALAA